MAPEIEVSVILPVCHGGNSLRRALQSLRHVDFPPDHLEVIAAVFATDEESRRAVAEEAAVASYQLLCLPCDTKARPRLLNRACGAAKGALLVFADDDCEFYQGWLRGVLEEFRRDPEAGIVGGVDIASGDPSAFNRALDCVLGSFLGTGGIRKGDGTAVGKYYPRLWNMAMPRAVALSVALGRKDDRLILFDERLPVHEDVDLGRRVMISGRRVLYAPGVQVRHHRETSLLSFIRRNFSMGRASRSLGIHRFPHLVLAAGVLGLFAASAGAIFVGSIRMPLLVSIGLYAAALFMVPLRTALRATDPNILALVPLLLFVLHFSRGIGYLFPLRFVRRSNP